MKRWHKIVLLILSGAFVGFVCLFLFFLRAHTYLTNNSSACMNCHIMAPYYATWLHSSHGRDANCNDCHVPHENAVRKWYFKGTDGMQHVAKYLTFSEHQVIHARDASAEVIMNNCIRCHTQLTSELVKDGKVTYMMTKAGEGKACWDCHRNIPHGGMNSLSSTPNARVPNPPASEAPEWLKKAMKIETPK